MDDTTKFLMIGGAGLIAYYFWSQKGAGAGGGDNGNGCPGQLLLLDGQEICDDELKELGFIFWGNRTTGPDGWYHLDSFSNPFNLPPATFIQAFQNAGTSSMDPNDPLFNNAQNLLNDYLIAGEAPLALA